MEVIITDPSPLRQADMHVPAIDHDCEINLRSYYNPNGGYDVWMWIGETDSGAQGIWRRVPLGHFESRQAAGIFWAQESEKLQRYKQRTPSIFMGWLVGTTDERVVEPESGSLCVDNNRLRRLSKARLYQMRWPASDIAIQPGRFALAVLTGLPSFNNDLPFANPTEKPTTNKPSLRSEEELRRLRDEAFEKSDAPSGWYRRLRPSREPS
jgi:hypothetical protein